MMIVDRRCHVAIASAIINYTEGWGLPSHDLVLDLIMPNIIPPGNYTSQLGSLKRKAL
jgi:hypothetical protein